MTECAQDRAHQCRLAGTEIAVEPNDHAGRQQWRQFPAKGDGCRLIRQSDSDGGGNRAIIASMQKDLTGHETLASSEGDVDWRALSALIKGWGGELGFAAVGIAGTDVTEASRRLESWLDAGYHGEMDYMAKHKTLRGDPDVLWPDVQSIISVRLRYWPLSTDARSVLADRDAAYVSRYALGRDYHKVMRQRLQKLGEKIGLVLRSVAPTRSFHYRAFADSAPVLESELARQAGTGWRGKHSLILTRAGSWHFLGELFTDLPLPSDTPAGDHCGTCRRCIEACPTGAIVAPYQIDARRCVSYLTIELAGPIPVGLRSLIGNRIYGCDDCQLDCPWNRWEAPGDGVFFVRHGLDCARLVELFAWDEGEFNERLAGSPIRRIGYQRWLRNIAVALGNAPPSAASREALCRRVDDTDSLVRDHVAWAIERQSAGHEE